MMSVGAKGVISVTSNLYPRAVSEVVEEALAERFAQARRLHLKLLPVHKVMFNEPNPSPIKAALARKGIGSDVVRPPLLTASAACKKLLVETLNTFEAP